MARPKPELIKKVRKERFIDLLDHLLTEAVHLGFSAAEVLGMVGDRVRQFQWQEGGRKTGIGGLWIRDQSAGAIA